MTLLNTSTNTKQDSVDSRGMINLNNNDNLARKQRLQSRGQRSFQAYFDDVTNHRSLHTYTYVPTYQESSSELVHKHAAHVQD